MCGAKLPILLTRTVPPQTGQSSQQQPAAGRMPLGFTSIPVQTAPAATVRHQAQQEVEEGAAAFGPQHAPPVTGASVVAGPQQPALELVLLGRFAALH